jgi:hypothetical protein
LVILGTPKFLHLLANRLPWRQQLKRQAVSIVFGGFDGKRSAPEFLPIHQVHMDIDGDASEEARDAFIRERWAHPVKYFEHARTETLNGALTREHIVAQKVRELMGNRKALLVLGVRTVNENQSVPEPTDQARPQRPILDVHADVCALLSQPCFSSPDAQLWEQNDRERERSGNGTAEISRERLWFSCGDPE